MKHHSWYQVERATDSECQFGSVSLDDVNQSHPLSSSKDGTVALIDGEVYNSDALWTMLKNSGVPRDTMGPAELLRRGYDWEGNEFFSRVNGKYSAAVWNSRQRTLALVTDPFGMKPIYYAHVGPRFAFASEIKSLLTLPWVPRSRNTRGIVQFFSLGQLWDCDTLFEHIKLVPPGSCALYRLDPRALTIQAYYHLPLPNPSHDVGAALERVDNAFRRSVELRSQHTHGLGIALSGGLDARTMLGVIDRTKHPVKSFCLGMPGSRDQLASRQMAQLVHSEYHEIYLDQHFLGHFAEHLDRMIQLTDGHYLSQCIVMPSLSKYREHGVHALLRGHAGELMHMRKAYNFSLDAQADTLKTEHDLLLWLSQRLQAYMLSSVEGNLFRNLDSDEHATTIRECLTKSLEGFAGCQRLQDRIWLLFIRERLRRETAMSLVKFDSVVRTRLPYVDTETIEALTEIPLEMRQEETIQQYLLKKRCPQLLSVVNVNTGARIGASSFVKSVQHLKTRVLAKLGIRGYQPYERLGLWLRRELRPIVRRILLDPCCLDRGVFDPDAVQRVVAEHFRGTKNHTFLLMAMMIYERGQQLLIDGSPVFTAADKIAHSVKELKED